MAQEYIFTYTKTKMNPASPKAEDIKIEDIAHALSYMTRANGHFPEFYTVCQHCIACCREAGARAYSQRVVLACLLHDAGEAYVSDITRPVKCQLTGYREIEDRLLNLIYTVFLGTPLTEEEERMVKDIDDSLLYEEFYSLMGERLQIAHTPLLTTPFFHTEDMKAVEQQYLDLFQKIRVAV